MNPLVLRWLGLSCGEEGRLAVDLVSRQPLGVRERHGAQHLVCMISWTASRGAAGRTVNEIGRAVDREVRRRGFRVVHGLSGHGVGKTIHEPPEVPNRHDPRLRTTGRYGNSPAPSHHGMYWNDLTPAERSALTCRSWLGNPLVRVYVNEQVSGRAEVWAVEWFGKRFASDRPFPTGLVIGCGTGELERDLLRRGICERLTALDIAPASVALARQQAERDQLQGRIEYLVQDGRSYLEKLSDRSLPAVFFHGSSIISTASPSCSA